MKTVLSHLGIAIAAAIITALMLRPAAQPDTPTAPGQAPTQPSTPAPGDDEQAAIEVLRRQHQQEIQWLQSIIEQLETSNRELQQQLASAQAASQRKQPQAANVWFDESALLDAGLDADDFSGLQQRVEALELQKLELANEATREGWVRNKAYYQRLRALDDQFRETLSDAEYDIYLYATGRSNRVSVSDVLENSPAGFAGIHSGDIIVSYAGEKVFDPTSLYRLTTLGQNGEMVPITLRRGDDLVTSYIPRGPLGTRIQASRQPPARP